MKAQRPVRDAQGNSVISDQANGEDIQGMCLNSECKRRRVPTALPPSRSSAEPTPRWNAGEPSSARPVSAEAQSRETSPRQRVHAIPSTIHEDDKEEADVLSARMDSPRFDSNPQSTITNSTVRAHGQRSSSSPSNTATSARPESAVPNRQHYSPTSPVHPIQPYNTNKENRDPDGVVAEGQMERISTDSKTWMQAKSTGENPHSPPLQTRQAAVQPPSYHPENANIDTPDDRELATRGHHPIPYQQYNSTPAVSGLPLITPTTARSMVAPDRRMDDAPAQHQVPPFVAYNTYQQAMTPLANGYPQMQMQQQPPSTVSQLPAGRKAFTVRNVLFPDFKALIEQ